ncbi:helix-turn-helix domain-containing protein [Nocardia sp. NPDC055321]
MVGSSVPGRAFGRELRSLRMRAGKSQLAAGLHIEMSPQSVGRMEDGRRIKISTAQIRELLDFYQVGNPSAERSEVLGLWQEMKDQRQAAKMAGTTKGWWRAFAGQYAPHFDHYLGLEASAARLTTHQVTRLPGLLQIPEYRRSMIEIVESCLPAKEDDRRLELAARRQARLYDPGFHVEALLSEAVLRHTPGGCDVMARQLRYLADLADTRSNVVVRIVPFRVGGHLGLATGSFTLLEFPHLASKLIEPPVVYVEGYEGDLYLEQQDAIDRHRMAIDDMRRVALAEDESMELVRRLEREYASGR